ncbi:MAG TPA: cupin domain-containing protein [Gammaproteobacteria bacterium]
MHRITTHSAFAALREVKDQHFVELFKHGSLSIEIYQPKGIDKQKPHTRDEVYVVISGKGFFVNGAERRPFEPGEVLFVSAGVEHRFESFREDFATWVIFYGPEGGEKA